MDIVKKIEDDILENEIHPASENINVFLNTIPHGKLKEMHLIFKENSLKGNKNATVCLYAIERFFNNESLTDTHILGLAWTILLILKEQKLEEIEKKVKVPTDD